MRGKILIVDDDRLSCEMLDEGLSHRDFAVVWCTSSAEALGKLREDPDIDVLITDLRLAGESGLDLCRAARELVADLPVIVITAFGNIETAVEAIRSGAYDFITKPFELDVIALAADRAVSHHGLRSELARLRKLVAAEGTFSEFVGTSPAMRRVFDFIERVGDSDSTILITGESGTGKELAARAVHQFSQRNAEPLVTVNCAAIPEALLESELFGHVRGAFTDARSDRVGLFVKAGKGSVFLDEIGDMPLAMQAKLLRALQEKKVRPVGSDREIPFEARVLAATHRDLEAEVAKGRFRRDLFYRINVIEVALPPLRTRGSDVLLLAQHFLTRLSATRGTRDVRLSPEAAELLLRYDWPGNVRELGNTIERAFALCRSERIGVDELPERVRRLSERRIIISADEPSELVSLEEVERRYILRVIQAVSGNKKLAADILGLDRSTLYRKLNRYGIDVS